MDQFLFRAIDPPPDADEIFAIDEYALASRLSYFLWSSMPDEELFRAATEQEPKQQGHGDHACQRDQPYPAARLRRRRAAIDL